MAVFLLFVAAILTGKVVMPMAAMIAVQNGFDPRAFMLTVGVFPPV